jgi:Domain of unknown function (DUF3560)
MRRAVKMWEQSKYWEDRARGAIRNAKYKERPDVRARRIKTLEADKRKHERAKAEHEKFFKAWTREDMTLERARQIANMCWLHVTDRWTAYDVLQPDEQRFLECPSWTVEQVQEAARRIYPAAIAFRTRWINHIENRLLYERAMLGESGGTVADRAKPEKGGGCKCWASPRGGWSYIQKVNKISVTVLDNWGHGGGNFTRNITFDKLAAVMTAAQIAEKRAAGELIEDQHGTGFHLVGEVPKGEYKTYAPKPESEKDAGFAALKDAVKEGAQPERD